MVRWLITINVIWSSLSRWYGRRSTACRTGRSTSSWWWRDRSARLRAPSTAARASSSRPCTCQRLLPVETSHYSMPWTRCTSTGTICLRHCVHWFLLAVSDKIKCVYKRPNFPQNSTPKSSGSKPLVDHNYKVLQVMTSRSIK